MSLVLISEPQNDTPGPVLGFQNNPVMLWLKKLRPRSGQTQVPTSRRALHVGSSGTRSAFAPGNEVPGNSPTSSRNFQESFATWGHQQLKHV